MKKWTTYELVQVHPDRLPVVGEIRYIMYPIPSPSEPLASMMLSDPIQIIWTGDKWEMRGAIKDGR